MSIKIKTTKSTENETKKVIRVSLETDKIIQEKLQKLNNDKEEYGKVNKEKLIHFFKRLVVLNELQNIIFPVVLACDFYNLAIFSESIKILIYSNSVIYRINSLYCINRINFNPANFHSLTITIA